MLRRNVDFFAVLIITLGMLAIAQASLRLREVDSIHLQNAIVEVQSCPLPGQTLSRIASLWSR